MSILPQVFVPLIQKVNLHFNLPTQPPDASPFSLILIVIVFVINHTIFVAHWQLMHHFVLTSPQFVLTLRATKDILKAKSRQNIHLLLTVALSMKFFSLFLLLSMILVLKMCII